MGAPKPITSAGQGRSRCSGENPGAGRGDHLRNGADTPEGVFDGEGSSTIVFIARCNSENTKK